MANAVLLIMAFLLDEAAAPAQRCTSACPGGDMSEASHSDEMIVKAVVKIARAALTKC
jgi:hypothetical protein